MDHDASEALRDLTLALKDAPLGTALRDLLEAQATIGTWVGIKARELAVAESWQAVAEVTETTRSACWQRWSRDEESSSSMTTP